MASFIQKISEKKLPIISPKGDTLIEVLLAIAIVSLVLAGAYVSSGSSLSVVRNTQEREEALKLAEGHLESLRQVVADGDDSVFDDSPALLFCFDSSNSKVLFSSSSLPGLDADDFSIYPSACKNVSQFYNISIKYDGSSEVFTSTVRWDNRQGEKSQVQLRYRFFIGSVSQIAPPPPAPSPVPVPAPGPGPGPGPAPAPCIANRRIILIIDTSSSMHRIILGGTDPLMEVVKGTASNFVDSIVFGPSNHRGFIATL